jgi:ABC-type sugar transport system substrate-binding protein
LVIWLGLIVSLIFSGDCLSTKKFNDSLSTYKQPLKVVFISPDARGNPYWDFVSNTMRKAVQDFGMQLTILYSSRHDVHDYSLLINHISRLDKPDFLIYVYQYKLGKKLLEYGEQNHIKSFVINTNIGEEQRQQIGRPTEKYKNWIGHSYANLSDISFALSKKAYNLAQPLTQIKEDKQVYGIVLSGSRDSDLALQWNHGVRQAAREFDDFHIKQTVYTSFNPDIGYDKAKKLLQRYPNVSVIVSIDENVALAAIKAAVELGRTPGEDIFIAGSASLLATFDMAEKNKLLASYALSMWFGVHAIVYIHDYNLNRYNQEKEFTYNFADTDMLPSQIPTYRKIIAEQTWKNIDYRPFSLAFSPHLQGYDFSLQAFEKAMLAIK